MEDVKNFYRVNINYHSGTVEAQGTESFIFQVMEKVQLFLSYSSTKTKTHSQPHNELTDSLETKENKSKQSLTEKANQSKSKGKKLGIPKILPDLHLGGDSHKSVPSLKEYVESFDGIQLGAEKLAPVIAHYLKEKKSIDSINENHLYTCLKHLKDSGFTIKLPNNPRQILLNAKRRGGYFQLTEDDNFSLSIAGENFVSDLKLQQKSKK